MEFLARNFRYTLCQGPDAPVYYHGHADIMETAPDEAHWSDVHCAHEHETPERAVACIRVLAGEEVARLRRTRSLHSSA
jgi:hypothetical protein